MAKRDGWESRNVKLPDDTWQRLRRVSEDRMVGHGVILAKAIDYYLDLLEDGDPLDPPPTVKRSVSEDDGE